MAVKRRIDVMSAINEEDTKASCSPPTRTTELVSRRNRKSMRIRIPDAEDIAIEKLERQLKENKLRMLSLLQQISVVTTACEEFKERNHALRERIALAEHQLHLVSK